MCLRTLPRTTFLKDTYRNCRVVQMINEPLEADFLLMDSDYSSNGYFQHVF